MLKNSFFLLSLFICSSIFSQPFWEKIEVPFSGILLDLEINNEGVIFIGIEEGVLRSYDNGNSWEFIDISESSNIIVYSLFSLNSDTIFAGTNIGIFKSTDSGNTWLFKFSDPANILCFESIYDSLIFAGGWGSIFYSNDYGESWCKNRAY